MRWNLVQQELRQNRRGFWTCFLVTLLILILLLGKAEAFVNNPEMEQLIKGLPEGLLKAFGIEPESFRTFEGFVATQAYPYFIVLISSFATSWAAGSISRERDRGTAEFLFTLPYSRGEVFWSKAFANWLHMTIVFVVGSLLILLLARYRVQLEQYGGLLLLLLSGYLLVLLFMGIGYALTSWFSSDRTAVAVGAGVAVLAFLLKLLSGSSEMMHKVSSISPYRLFDALDIVRGGGLTAVSWVVTLGLYAAGTAIGVLMLKRKDIV